jgi:hypothetical protein
MAVTRGFRRAIQLHRLVLLVWLVSLAIFAPVVVIVQMMAGPARAHRPPGGYGGEDLVVFFEIMRPLVIPLVVTLGFCCLTFVVWWILWHAGAVRWFLKTDAFDVRLGEIVGLGVAVWWRYARLALVALVLLAIAVVVPWLPLLADFKQPTLRPLLVLGSASTILGVCLVWLAALRGAWLLAEPNRRSALVAWLRGLFAVLRHPLQSTAPLLVWALPGVVLLLLPLWYDGPAATFVLLVSWLLSVFFRMALHFSYAPTKPPPEREISPLEPPGPSYRRDHLTDAPWR